MTQLSKKLTVRALIESRDIIAKIQVPHRHIQKSLDNQVELIYEEILIEVLNTDIGDHVQTLDNPMEFIEAWAKG